MEKTLDEIKQEVDEMTKAFESLSVATEPPITEAPGESVATEPPVDESEDAPPSTTAPIVNEEAIILKAENEQLKKQLESYKHVIPVTDPPPEAKDFIGDLDPDELMKNPSEFNKLLNKVYTEGVLSARKSVLITIPDIVKKNITILDEVRKTADNFFKANEDLISFKNVVKVIFDEEAAKNPGRELNEILIDVEKETRKRLNLKKPEQSNNTNTKPKSNLPNLPHKKGNQVRTVPSKSTGTEAEIAEMNKVLNN